MAAKSKLRSNFFEQTKSAREVVRWPMVAGFLLFNRPEQKPKLTAPDLTEMKSKTARSADRATKGLPAPKSTPSGEEKTGETETNNRTQSQASGRSDDQ